MTARSKSIWTPFVYSTPLCLSATGFHQQQSRGGRGGLFLTRVAFGKCRVRKETLYVSDREGSVVQGWSPIIMQSDRWFFASYHRQTSQCCVERIYLCWSPCFVLLLCIYLQRATTGRITHERERHPDNVFCLFVCIFVPTQPFSLPPFLSSCSSNSFCPPYFFSGPTRRGFIP
jgi:hypothetical protein